MAKQREHKIELLRQILNGSAKVSALTERKQFEVWTNINHDFNSHTSIFKNGEGVQQSRADIEINEALGKGAVYNIFILGVDAAVPLSGKETDVLL